MRPRRDSKGNLDIREEQKISKFTSLLLRHKPEKLGLSMDRYGWVSVEELVKGLEKSYEGFSREDLEYIVRKDSKQRYRFNEDGSKVRASQGHSIKLDIEFKEKVPDEVLYHGTATRFLDKIMAEGLKSMSRQYVHLSKDIETARSVGNRHGDVVVLLIDVARMVNDGYKFKVADNGVWLTDEVPKDYLSIIGD